MPWNFDYLIVGAGLSGLVLAERLSTQRGKSCLIVEKRPHIGGNCYDEYDSHGVLLHKYGPHYFRTNSNRIIEYLSQFTDWIDGRYEILSYTDKKFWSFPINLLTFEQMLGRSSTEHEFSEYLAKNRVLIETPKNSEEVIISQVGWELYNKFFKNYTIKQWKRHPRELDASVCGRIPIRTVRDGRYFNDKFQLLPASGYTRMFQNMLASSNKIKIMYKTNFREVVSNISFGHLIYTGPIDEYFDFSLGHLPYRSLKFEAESFSADQLKSRINISRKSEFWQPAVQVNYPNEEDYTRIVEAKHVTGQKCSNTTIVREYPMDWSFGAERYYPIPSTYAQTQYLRYKELAENQSRVSFVGRLATYKYYNMDQIVGMALSEFENLRDS